VQQQHLATYNHKPYVVPCDPQANRNRYIGCHLLPTKCLPAATGDRCSNTTAAPSYIDGKLFNSTCTAAA
jgi:hypothetical protein